MRQPETYEQTEMFEGTVIDMNEYSATGKIGNEHLNEVAHIGDKVFLILAAEVVAITHTDDPKRGMVRGHKLSIVEGVFTTRQAWIDECARQGIPSGCRNDVGAS